jgi:hypothetical protein
MEGFLSDTESRIESNPANPNRLRPGLAPACRPDYFNLTSAACLLRLPLAIGAIRQGRRRDETAVCGAGGPDVLIG